MAEKKEQKRGRGRPISGEAKREITAFKFEPAFLDRLRRAAHHSPKTATQIVEEGAAIILDRLEKENGGPFPPVPVKEKRGK